MMSDVNPELEIEDVESRILAFVQRDLLSSETTVDRDQDLLSGSLLDSMAALRLAAFVEAEFQITIQPADFVIENFQSIAVLAEYVRRRSGHQEP
jgi:acyl carrier protein